MIAADTSFLFSLYGSDGHTAAARTWAVQARRPIAITVLNRYEFGNAIRFAAFRRAIAPADARASLAAFETDVRQGLLQVTPCDLAAIVVEAQRLSEQHTIPGGHRSFDILHIATARVLKAALLLTFDLNQRKLAQAVRLAVAP